MDPLPFVVAAAVATLTAVSTRNLFAAGIATFWFCAAVLFVRGASDPSAAPFIGGSVSVALLAASVAGAARTGVFRVGAGVELKPWRLIARPFALLFIPIDARWGQGFLLVLVGIVAAIFIAADLLRIFSNLHWDRLYKKGERKTFSSMTAYLVSVFLVFLLFPAPISYLSLLFLTVGDPVGKLIGIRFGRTPLVGQRTLEGSLGYVAGALAAGGILHEFVPFPVPYLPIGAVAAASIEVFSRDVDDNLTVGLLSGAILSIVKLFFRI